MKLTVLGCSGGIGGRGARTTSFLADRDTLIDCGTGVGELEYADLLGIDRVFISHSHLDHIAMLPLLVDTVAEARQREITVFALPETLDILRAHVFNWLIWPDFSAIPDRREPFLRLQPVNLGEAVHLPGGRRVTLLPAHHTVPASALCLDSGEGKLVYSGDTTHSPDLVAAINALDGLRHFIVETAFSDAQRALALSARHLCPSLLAAFLDDLQVTPEVWISHLKPGIEEQIMAEVQGYKGRLQPKALQNGQVLEF